MNKVIDKCIYEKDLEQGVHGTVVDSVNVCNICGTKRCVCAHFTCRIIMSGLYCLRSPMSYIRNLSMLKASSSPMCNSSTPAMKDRPWQ